MENNTRLRGIHQGMVQYSQNNNQWFPGFDASGNMVNPSTVG